MLLKVRPKKKTFLFQMGDGKKKRKKRQKYRGFTLLRNMFKNIVRNKKFKTNR